MLCRALALITALLDWCSPPHVSRFVVSVDIDTVETVSRGGTPSHMGKERGKVLAPDFADLNASAAIVSVVGAVGIGAAAAHFLPCPILGCSLGRVPGRFTMPTAAGNKLFSSEASATLRLAPAQLVSRTGGDSAAIAAAFPHQASRWCRAEFLEDDEPTEATPDQFDACWHRQIISCGDSVEQLVNRRPDGSRL